MPRKRKQMPVDTHYITTDFDLRSKSPFDSLHCELDQTCCVLIYAQEEGGDWFATVHSLLDDGITQRVAADDILAMIGAINALSPAARAEFDACYLREFNLGFECGDTRSFVHTLPSNVVCDVADVNCSLTVTLYAMRNPDGTLRE